MQDEIQRLIEGLVKRGMRERADAVSNAVREVIGKCKDAVNEMYPPNLLPVEGFAAREGISEAGERINGAESNIARPTGGDATLLDSLQEMGRRREPPMVKAFEKLSLLG
jgi:elongator complex protein 1